MLLMPDEKRQDPRGGMQAAEQMLSKPADNRHDSKLEDAEKLYLNEVVSRLCNTRRDDRPNHLQVFALQAPIMLLSMAVLSFLAGLCSVIFAPLAKRLAWDDDAKVRASSLTLANDKAAYEYRLLWSSAS